MAIYTKINSLLSTTTNLKIVPDRGRHIKIRPEDIFIVSYPKSGNTWMRFLLSNILLQEESANFSNIDQTIPDIYISGNKALKKIESPRILKSHEYFDPRYKRVVYLVRNPKSVAVSYFHFLRRMNWIAHDIDFKVFLQMLIEGAIDNYGNWAENVGSWIGARENDENFMLIKYEDLKLNPTYHLEATCKFLGLKSSEKSISEAVKNSSFGKMKKLENKEQNMVKGLKKRVNDIPFIRNGKTNEWKHYFDEASEQLILDNFGHVMNLLNYK